MTAEQIHMVASAIALLEDDPDEEDVAQALEMLRFVLAHA